MKKSKLTTAHFITGNILCLSTALMFVLFWKELPEIIAIQWNFQGEVSNTASKLTLALFIPLGTLAINLFTCLRHKEEERWNIEYYLVPIIGHIIACITIFMALR